MSDAVKLGKHEEAIDGLKRTVAGQGIKLDVVHDDVIGMKKDVKQLATTTTQINSRQEHLLLNFDELLKTHRERTDKLAKGLDETFVIVKDHGKRISALEGAGKKQRSLWRYLAGIAAGIGGVATALWGAVKAGLIKVMLN